MMLGKTLRELALLSTRISSFTCRCCFSTINSRFTRSLSTSSNSPTWSNERSDPGRPEGPLQFTGSKAAVWNPNEGFNRKRDIPEYQPIIISISVAAFLIYFLVLREENDVDVELNRSLFERVPGLEEQQLKLALKFNKGSPEVAEELEKRLADIIKEKDQSTNN